MRPGQRPTSSPVLDSGMRPRDAIETAIVGHAELLTAASRSDDHEITEPSLLPGWSRAHVIAHLAHKTWSHVTVFEGGVVGDVRPQYPEGRGAAEAETEMWSRRSAGALREVLRDGFAALGGWCRSRRLRILAGNDSKLAASPGEADIVERLLRQGADADATCPLPTVWGGTPNAKWTGETPVQWAEHFGRTDVVELLNNHRSG